MFDNLLVSFSNSSQKYGETNRYCIRKLNKKAERIDDFQYLCASLVSFSFLRRCLMGLLDI